jgi:hypothetical protein
MESIPHSRSPNLLRGRSHRCETLPISNHSKHNPSGHRGKEISHQSHHSLPKSSRSLEFIRQKFESSITSQHHQNETSSTHKIKEYLLSKRVLYTHMIKGYISIKITLDNYDDLINPSEHV